MKEVLELIFSSVWTFVGTCVIIVIFGDVIVDIIRAIKR